MYNNISSAAKTALKSRVVTTTARITLTSNNQVIDGNNLVNVTITDQCYENGVIVGTAMSKEVEIELIDNNYDLADKEFSLEVGVLLPNNSYEYIPYGNFIVKDYQKIISSNHYRLIAYDYMDKFNSTFVDNNSTLEDGVTYTTPMTLQSFYQYVANQFGVSIQSQSNLPNANFSITTKPYFDGMSGRTVISRIAEMMGCFAKINRSNKIEMRLKTTTSEKFSRNEMNNSLERDNRFGPINVVSLRLSQVEGENVTKRDESSISQYGETTLQIQDNPFCYTEALRLAAINAIYNKVDGFSYYPTTFNGKLIYLDAGDEVEVQDMETDTYYKTIILKQVLKIPSTRNSKFENKALTDTGLQYQFTPEQVRKDRRTEYIVDKQNGAITQLVETTETIVNESIPNLQAQIDGAIQFWNGASIPTLNNYPANEWTTEAERNNHRADIYTVIEDVQGELKQGKSYRFDKVGSTWQWVELTDNELSAVQALANSKAKVFYTTPTVPYNLGDLWLKDGKLYRCKTAKGASGSYSASDWEEAVEYTDDTLALLAQSAAEAAQGTADGAVTAINNIKDTTGQAEGKYIYLDDSSDDTIISAKFNGETSQDGTPSPDYPSEIINLQGRNSFPGWIKGKGLQASTGAETTNENAANCDFIPVDFNKNTNYFVSGLTNSLSSFVGAYNSNKEFLGRTSATATTYFLLSSTSFTGGTAQGTGNIAYLRLTQYALSTSTGTIDDVDNLKTQLEIGIGSNLYSPKDNIAIKVANKNLLDKNKSALGSNVTKTVLDTGVRVTTKVAGNARYCGIEVGRDELLGKKVTIKSNITASGTNNARARLFFGKADSPSTSGIGTGLDSTGSITNTIPSTFYTGTDRIYLLLYSNVSGDTSIDNYVDYTNLQVEIGDEATEYEEYQEQTIYFPLEEGQKLYEGSYLADDEIHNVRKQFILDGTTAKHVVTNVLQYSNGLYYCICSPIPFTSVNGIDNLVCSHFKAENGIALNHCYITGSGLVFVFVLTDQTITNPTAANNWLAQQYSNGTPVTVECLLPEEEIIPYNAEQQEVWNNIKNLHTYKNITNIYSDAYAEIEYAKDNGLDIYETKANANVKYTETIEKFAQQQITNESITNTVSQTVTTVANNYNELKTKFDDYAPKSDVVSLQTSVNQVITNTYTKTEVNEKLIDGSVQKVSTTSGTFDSNGLTIEKTDAKTKGRFNETGITVMDATSSTEEELLFAGYDEELNETIVRTKNITVEKYLTLKDTIRMEYYENPVLGGHGVGFFIL